MLWLMLQTPRQPSGEPAPDVLPAAVWALAVGLLLARMGYAAAYLTYYLEHPVEVLWLWQGGLSGAGGLLGAVLGAWLYARISTSDAPKVFDQLAVPGLIVAVSCWIGCWLDGCAYGLPLQASFPLFRTADMFGARIARWPAALLGLVPLLAGLAILYRVVARRQRRGRRAAISFSAIAFSILLASLLRADPMPVLLDIRLDTLSGLVLSIAGASALLISFRKG